MADPAAQDVAERLLAPAFRHTGPDLDTITDPIADTPMVVTLDQLQPYSLDPRITRNPLYDDIKESIRERGLDSPPSITRRPGDNHYCIRNGGNTRLSILRDLWAETRDERFFRIPCLFRPWTSRGEIVALAGHLCENELRGNLTFIERALSIGKLRELYEVEVGESLSQMQIVECLKKDGVRVSQSHLSKMQDAVRYLLPAIPSVLYAGLGKPQIERITTLRRAGERAWKRHSGSKSLPTDFPSLFQDVLATFDDPNAEFNVERVRDELVGQLTSVLGIDYDVLVLEFVDAEARDRALMREPGSQSPAITTTQTVPLPSLVEVPAVHQSSTPAHRHVPDTPVSTAASTSGAKKPAPQPEADGQNTGDSAEPSASDEQIKAHIVSTADTTNRLQAVQRTIAQATGEPIRDFAASVIESVPVQAGGLYPISDVWYIEAGLDAIDRLRIHIAQFAREIAEEAQTAERIEAVDGGIGFVCIAAENTSNSALSSLGRSVLALLHALSAGYTQLRSPGIDSSRLDNDLASLLLGELTTRRASRPRLSDAGVVKLFRLIRLARRLVELESTSSSPASSARR